MTLRRAVSIKLLATGLNWQAGPFSTYNRGLDWATLSDWFKHDLIAT